MRITLASIFYATDDLEIDDPILRVDDLEIIDTPVAIQITQHLHPSKKKWLHPNPNPKPNPNPNPQP